MMHPDHNWYCRQIVRAAVGIGAIIYAFKLLIGMSRFM